MFKGRLNFVNNTIVLMECQSINNFFFWSFYRIFTKL